MLNAFYIHGIYILLVDSVFGRFGILLPNLLLAIGLAIGIILIVLFIPNKTRYNLLYCWNKITWETSKTLKNETKVISFALVLRPVFFVLLLGLGDTLVEFSIFFRFLKTDFCHKSTPKDAQTKYGEHV